MLEVGCGTGRNLIAAAQRWRQARFTGLDISAAMLETAGASLQRHRLVADRADRGGRLRIHEQPPPSPIAASIASSSYALSMIPAWECAIEEALGALTPEGCLHIVDFRQQERLPAPFRAMLFAWLRHFHVSPRGGLRAVLEDAARRHGRTLAFRALYRGYAWEVVLR